MSSLTTRLKLVAILLSILLPYTFIQYTKSEFEKITGIKQYSYISGWKLASNALYIYHNVYKKYPTNTSEKFKVLDSLARNYFNENKNDFFDLKNVDSDPTLGSWFIVKVDAPLMEYMHYIKNDNFKNNEWENFEVENMAPLGPFFKDYGYYMIRKYPLAYLKYIIYPDLLSYLYPFSENLTNNYEPFSLWPDRHGEIAKTTLNLSKLNIRGKYMKLRYDLLNPFPTIFYYIHLFYLLILLCFLFGGSNRNLSRDKTLIISILNIICLTNFLFVILIHTSAIRYEVFIIFLELGLGITMAHFFSDQIKTLKFKKCS
ncbi:hypothetical protein [Chitinophaga sancti]|uniref:Uncharacterized protein n=1 Tax=Chitinophaga sancti TaxID=1004 RepID=A0ABZ0XCI3_9BACT|nr:hypothetical protein [Chitinophaga sancti]WQD59556.1 hypothetical protein U0033_16810 [Chitinophaga sancti]WQG88310.1 hypothetical protein SR876_25655 [Chitinophaga sancti]